MNPLQFYCADVLFWNNKVASDRTTAYLLITWLERRISAWINSVARIHLMGCVRPPPNYAVHCGFTWYQDFQNAPYNTDSLSLSVVVAWFSLFFLTVDKHVLYLFHYPIYKEKNRDHFIPERNKQTETHTFIRPAVRCVLIIFKCWLYLKLEV